MKRTAVLWPSKKFYWAQLDASALPKEPTREQLGYLLERFVPEPIENLHPLFVDQGNRRFLAIAARRIDITGLGREVSSLRPSDKPEFLRAELELEQLEFLTGAFLPAGARKAAKLAIAAPLGAALLVAVCLTTNLVRKRTAVEQLQSSLAAATEAALTAALGPSIHQSPLPPELQLEAALRDLRRTRTSPAQSERPLSKSHFLGSLLGFWPRQSQLLVESLLITDSGANVQGLAGSAATVQALAAQLEWGMEAAITSPSIRTTAEGVRFDLQVPLTSGGASR